MEYVTRIQSHEFLIEKMKEELSDKENEYKESELKVCNQRVWLDFIIYFVF